MTTEAKKEYCRQWHLKNAEQVSASHRLYYAGRSAQIKARSRKWYAENLERAKETRKAHYRANAEKYIKRAGKFAKENPERTAEYKRRWKKKDPEHVRELARRQQDFRYRNDPVFNITRKLRSRISCMVWKAKRGWIKADQTIKLLGCSFSELKIHLENQFTLGMTWEALLDARIEIDHIRPCASFDLTKPEQQKQCFHFSNLQPLWTAENRKKHDRVTVVTPCERGIYV